MNSARVAGGVAPAPLHSTPPEPQSPVEHVPWPEPSNSQPVRPQKRPDHPVGASKDRDPPFLSSNPVLPSFGLPVLESIPGHTVKSHLFTSVNVAPDDNETKRLAEKRSIFTLRTMSSTGNASRNLRLEDILSKVFIPLQVVMKRRVHPNPKSEEEEWRLWQRKKNRPMWY